MVQFELIRALRTYATSLGWVFLYGDNFIQEWEATRATLQTNKIILGCSFGCTPLYRNSKVYQISYNGQMMLGRKFETLTRANLDETHIQKYDNRLEELTKLLSLHIGLFSCNNELTVSAVNMRYDLNKFDEDIDFVAANITFVQ